MQNSTSQATASTATSSSERSKYPLSDIKRAGDLVAGGLSDVDAAEKTGVTARMIGYWKVHPDYKAYFAPRHANVLDFLKPEVKQFTVDKTASQRKAEREQCRIKVAVAETQQALASSFDGVRQYVTVEHPYEEEGVKGLIHLCDLHLNYDDEGMEEPFISVAAKRLALLSSKFIAHAKSNSVEVVTLVLGGDIATKKKHTKELGVDAKARASMTLVMADLIAQMIEDLNTQGFNINVIGITSTESVLPTNEQVDSYDMLVFNALVKMFRGNAGGIGFSVAPRMASIGTFTINKATFMVLHGRSHKVSLKNNAISRTVDNMMATHGKSRNNTIDYVLCGKEHDAMITDSFARSGSLVGLDELGVRAGATATRASQNYFLIDCNGRIDGVRVDLEDTKGVVGYKYNEEAYAQAASELVRYCAGFDQTQNRRGAHIA